MRIRTKIFVYVLTTTMIIFATAIGIVSLNYRKMAMHDAQNIANSYATQSAYMARAILEVDLGAARTLSQAMTGYKEIPQNIREPIYNNILSNVLDKNPDFLSTWTSWEISAFDPSWKKPYGRVRTAVTKENGRIAIYVDSVDTEGDDITGNYYKAKSGAFDELLTNPYLYNYAKLEGGKSFLEASVGVPIITDGKFVGLAGIDVPLTRFQSIIQKITPFDSSYVFIVSNNGQIIAHPDVSNSGKFLTDIYPEYQTNYKISEYIQNGLYHSFTYTDNSKKEYYVSFAPIVVGKTRSPWSLAIVVPVEIIMSQAIINFRISLIVALIGMILLSVVVLVIAQNITEPLKQTTEILKKLDSGQIAEIKQLTVKSNDEIGEMSKSVNKLIDTLNLTATFAKNIGKGNYTAEFKVLNDDDVLGNALLDMRKNLIQAQEEEENRKLENQKLNWTQNGIAQIGEIIRKHIDNMEDFSYSIISFLVKYLEANQGGLFVINDDSENNKFIELKAFYAYDRKKIFESKFDIGESLIGRCIKEKETIHINSLPEGYVYINSGLGEQSPKNLLIVPLNFEMDVYGAIEIGSFKNFHTYQIEFLERVAERVASTVSNIKKNIRTAELLKQSQKQSEELALHEKEMRQSFRELQEAQEEAIRKELETAGIIEAIASTASVVQYDMTGKITNIHDRKLYEMGFLPEDLIGKNQRDLAPEAKENPAWYKNFWDDLKAGRPRKRIFKVKNKNGEFWYAENYTPILNQNGKPYKVINIGIDITELKRLETKIAKLEEELKEKSL